jgi:hypothetical protein
LHYWLTHAVLIISPLMPEEEAVFTITNGGIADRA